jgi:hypothetical protein
MPALHSKENTGTIGVARRRSLAMHSSQCTVCRHPQRAEIERDFLDWIGPRKIAREYGLSSHTTLYRHAHALGLFHRRRHTLQFALSRLIEQVDDVKPTAASIISAIRLMTKLNARSEYAEETETGEAAEMPAAPAPETEAATKAIARPAPAPAQPPAAASVGGNAKSARASGEEEKPKPGAEPGAEKEYNGPPIAFAQNAGPRRRFLWR